MHSLRGHAADRFDFATVGQLKNVAPLCGTCTLSDHFRVLGGSAVPRDPLEGVSKG